MVDFTKYLKNKPENQETQSMSNNSLVVPDFGKFDFGQFVKTDTTITTTDGQQVALPDGVSLLDLEGGGGGGEPIGSLKPGQPTDENFPNQIYFLRPERFVDEAAGKSEWKRIPYGPLGKTLEVFPIGILPSGYNRSYMPKFDPRSDKQTPLCHSENGIAPDARYAGKLGGKNTTCAVLTQQGLKDVCPFAQWTEDEKGNRVPPPCGKQYVVAVAFALESDKGREMVIAEIYFKSSSASAGRDLVRTLLTLGRKGQPLWTLPVQLQVSRAGVGNTLIPAYKATLSADTFTEDDRAGFEEATRRWAQALEVRARRAVTVDQNGVASNGNGNGNGRPVVTRAAHPEANDEALI